MDKALMFSSARDDWETPQWLFDWFNAQFCFSLDAAASEKNHKCAKYFTTETDGLSQDWGGERVWCNPPYGRSTTGRWIRKGWEETFKPCTTVVMLLPARTDTVAFHRYILGSAGILFVRGRLKFEIDAKPVLDRKGRPMPAPFPSMVVIWQSGHDGSRVLYDKLTPRVGLEITEM